MQRRWIIRGFILALLALFLTAWVWSYIYSELLIYCRSDYVMIAWGMDDGKVLLGLERGWGYSFGFNYKHTLRSVEQVYLGHSFEIVYDMPPPKRMGMHIVLPLWLPLIICSCLLIFVWRKTRRSAAVAAFTIEPSYKK